MVARSLSTLALLPRRIHVFFTAAIVYFAIKSTQHFLRARARLLHSDHGENDPYHRKAWSRTHNWCAARLLRLAMRRRALWLKLCQYLSSRADVLPPEYCVVLEACLDAVPPESPAVLLQVVTQELGGRNPHDIFDDFDPAAPIASASIAQVHLATLRTGQEPPRKVVLKVQRPGIRQVLLQDLEDLTTIMLLVAGAEPKFDFRPMLQAWVDMVPRETDFVHEMRCGQFVSRTLEEARGTKFESAAFVPQPLPEFTTERLFVMEYVNGCSVRDTEAMDKAGVDRKVLVTEISKAFALQAHILGRINADCHPGNILVRFNDDAGTPGGVPALIDFGITVELTEKQRLGFCRTVLAAADNNSFSLLQSFEDMGIVLNRADPASAMDLIKHLFRSTASREDTLRQSKEFVRRQKERDKKKMDSGIAVQMDYKGGEDPPSKRESASKKKWRSVKVPDQGGPVERDLTRNPVDAFPGYLVFMFRTLALLRGLCSRLGVEHAYLPILSEYAKQAMHDACPKEDRMSDIIYPLPPNLPRSMNSRKAMRLRKILSRVVPELERRGLIIGCQAAAYLKGEKVLDLAAGRMGIYNPRPVKPSTLFNVFSVSKGVVAILFAKAADMYNIDYDDPVAKFWPDFASHGKESTTIRHILSHTAGLAQAGPPDMSMMRLKEDVDGVIDWFAQEAVPAHVPGTKQAYHYLSFGWLVAGILRAVSGKGIQEHLAELANDLGLEGECYIGLPEHLCADAPTSPVALLHSSIFSDLEKILSRRQHKSAASSSEVAGSPQDTTGSVIAKVDGLPYPNVANKLPATKAAESSLQVIDDQARNMESMYNDNETPTDAYRFLYDQFFGQTDSAQTDVAVASVARSEKISNTEKQEIFADVFSRTPYLLEPEFFSHPVMRAAIIPSANGHFSARALARIYAMVANDGVLDGKRVLCPGRAKMMMEALHESANSDSNPDRRQTWLGEGYGAGVRLYDVIDKRGNILKKKAMGHGGVGGSMSLCLPEYSFSFAFTCNQLNALSAAEAVLIAIVFSVLEVPMPRAYAEMMSKVKQEGFSSAEEAFESVEKQIDSWLDDLNLMQAMTG